MLPILQTLLRALARAVASESGELLSTRRKYHLLQSELYRKLDRESRQAR
jgi:hypothetical protein